ncbi:MAG: hypothetical protein HQL69_17060 [Magnetococcales bacterium]|nr:hypothetical protein [Magnetococcales bacterium]
MPNRDKYINVGVKRPLGGIQDDAVLGLMRASEYECMKFRDQLNNGHFIPEQFGAEKSLGHILGRDGKQLTVFLNNFAKRDLKESLNITGDNIIQISKFLQGLVKAPIVSKENIEYRYAGTLQAGEYVNKYRDSLDYILRDRNNPVEEKEIPPFVVLQEIFAIEELLPKAEEMNGHIFKKKLIHVDETGDLLRCAEELKKDGVPGGNAFLMLKDYKAFAQTVLVDDPGASLSWLIKTRLNELLLRFYPYINLEIVLEHFRKFNPTFASTYDGFMIKKQQMHDSERRGHQNGEHYQKTKKKALVLLKKIKFPLLSLQYGHPLGYEDYQFFSGLEQAYTWTDGYRFDPSFAGYAKYISAFLPDLANQAEELVSPQGF